MVREFLESECLVVRADDPVVSILGKAFARDESTYWQDLVVDASGGYLGLLKANVLAKLQNNLLREKMEHHGSVNCYP